MDRSGLTELRKIFTFKKGEMTFGTYAGCFINTKKEIKGVFKRPFLTEEEPVIHKFLDIYKKTLANDDTDVGFNEADKKDGGCQFLFEKLRGTELKNDAINSILYEKIRDALPEKNYVVTLTYGTYDVPVKTKDRQKIDDAGAEILKYIICAVCPVKTQKGSIGYLPDKEVIGENPQQMTIEKPVFGFMYPSFNDRAADTDNVLCYRTEELDISAKLFGHQASAAIKKEKKAPSKKTDVSALQDNDKYVPAPAKNVAAKNTANIPSIDSGTLSNDAHYVAEKTVEQDDVPEEKTPDKDVHMVSFPSGTGKVSSATKPVTIRGDKKKVTKKVVDRVTCYVIPVDEAELVET